ncbi:MAG TPA: glycosyl hydrolase 115 family protein, partial [Chitinophagaceae bacterium]|nr:glycosyl hydrolase 115 family protein [Chitinophagaceae bacterium]
MYKGNVLLLPLAVFVFISVQAQQVISDKPQPGSLEIVSANNTAIICTDPADFDLIRRSASLLQQDVEMVTGKKLSLATSLPSSAKNIIIIGTIEKSKIIQQLIQLKKLSVNKIKNKWDAYLIQTVANPFKGITSAIVITGGNKRGVAYGTLELSKQMGVSPWYWWADVPVKKKATLYFKSGITLSDAPKVKYRGIFINDEAPAFSGWTKEKFGGFNHLVYEKMFELILRLKGNYLWPAMWGNAFYDDDSLNIKSADEYGIVIGTSHHEPLMRAHDEWRRYG